MGKGEASNSVGKEDIVVEIKKNENNSRNVQCKVAIKANFDIIWKILTDYEKLIDVMHGMTDVKLIDKKDNTARVCQISEVKLPVGPTKKSKLIMDYFEKKIESSAYGKKGDIEFKIVEGADFQMFEGKWSIEEVNKPRSQGSGSSVGEGIEATLSYVGDIKPNSWLPFHLVEGKARRDLRTSFSNIREKAEEMMHAQRTAASQ